MSSVTALIAVQDKSFDRLVAAGQSDKYSTHL